MPDEIQRPGRGVRYGTLLVGVFSVSSGAVFARYAQREAGSLAISAYRVTIAFLVLLPFALRHSGVELRCLSRRQWRLATLSGLFLALHFATWITSLSHTSVANSVVLVNTNPLWVGLLTPLFLRERLARTAKLGIVLSVAGAVLIGSSSAGETGREHALLGDGLALVGGLCAAAYLLLGRHLRRELSVLAYVCVCYGTAAGFLWILALASGQAAVSYSAATWGCLLGLALVSQILGHTSYNLALGWFSAALIAVSLLGEPILSALFAYLLFGEGLAPLQWLGGAAILSAIYLTSRGEVDPDRTPTS